MEAGVHRFSLFMFQNSHLHKETMGKLSERWALGPLGATGAIQNGELLPLPTCKTKQLNYESVFMIWDFDLLLRWVWQRCRVLKIKLIQLALRVSKQTSDILLTKQTCRNWWTMLLCVTQEMALLLVMSDADQVCRDGMVHIEPGFAAITRSIQSQWIPACAVG